MLQRPPCSPLVPYTALFRSLTPADAPAARDGLVEALGSGELKRERLEEAGGRVIALLRHQQQQAKDSGDRKSTRLNSSHVAISYAVFCLKKKTSRGHVSRRG